MLLINTFWLMVLLVQQGLCMRIRTFEVPLHVRRGQNVTLKCEFDMQDEKLYSIKWYKGGREFFRYVPHERPQKATYDLTGVNVDMNASDGQVVFLKSVTLATSGRYKCEVLAEAPAFNTLVEHAILTVVEIPSEKPVVIGGRAKYQPGDMVRLNCTSSPSKPAATLTWFINGKRVTHKHRDQHYLSNYQPIMLEDGLEVSILGLTFRATREHFPGNILSLKCSSEIGIYYNQTLIGGSNGGSYQGGYQGGYADHQQMPSISSLSSSKVYANRGSTVGDRRNIFILNLLLALMALQASR